MQYALLIYISEAEAKKSSPAEATKVSGDYIAFTVGIKQSGHLRAGEALEGVTTATTVRVREGKTLRTDGPFAETREQLAGFYIVEARDLDEAVTLAAKIPGAGHGSVEVRPVKNVNM